MMPIMMVRLMVVRVTNQAIVFLIRVAHGVRAMWIDFFFMTNHEASDHMAKTPRATRFSQSVSTTISTRRLRSLVCAGRYSPNPAAYIFLGSMPFFDR